MIRKAIKKPIEIEFVEWTGDNLREVIEFTGLHDSASKWTWTEFEKIVETEGLKIFTPSGPVEAVIGDQIMKGVTGEVYPCKPDIFALTYREVKR